MTHTKRIIVLGLLSCLGLAVFWVVKGVDGGPAPRISMGMSRKEIEARLGGSMEGPHHDFYYEGRLTRDERLVPFLTRRTVHVFGFDTRYHHADLSIEHCCYWREERVLVLRLLFKQQETAVSLKNITHFGSPGLPMAGSDMDAWRLYPRESLHDADQLEKQSTEAR